MFTHRRPDPAANLLGGSDLGRLRRLGVLQHLDDLLLFDQESAHDAFANALVAQHTAVRTTHGLLALGDARTLRRTGRPDAVQLLLALAALRHVTAFLHVLVDQTATGRANTAIGGKHKQVDISAMIFTSVSS